MNAEVKKNVIILRSTSIKNDSRVIKEAKALYEFGYKVIILGWDRDNFLTDDKGIVLENDDIIPIKIFKQKSQYSAGMKNIFNEII